MKLLIAGALLAISGYAQQMVSMRTSGDTAILTIRVDPRNFVTVSGAPDSRTATKRDPFCDFPMMPV
ncbi:MAG TPA: hypothetical protein VGL82_12060 [Bryobacteraceae bacterium]|jgi:hypothetical protein